MLGLPVGPSLESWAAGWCLDWVPGKELGSAGGECGIGRVECGLVYKNEL